MVVRQGGFGPDMSPIVFVTGVGVVVSLAAMSLRSGLRDVEQAGAPLPDVLSVGLFLGVVTTTLAPTLPLVGALCTTAGNCEYQIGDGIRNALLYIVIALILAQLGDGTIAPFGVGLYSLAVGVMFGVSRGSAVILWPARSNARVGEMAVLGALTAALVLARCSGVRWSSVCYWCLSPQER